MSGSYPLTERPGGVILRGWAPGDVSQTHNLTRQARSRGAHRWYLELIYGPMLRARWSRIVGFLDEQDGQFEKFNILVPGYETPQGAVSGTIRVNGIHAIGARSIAVDGFVIDTANVFISNDIITFAGHKKVYGVTRDVSASNTGTATVYLSSPLMTALADNEIVTWQNVTMQVAKVDDSVEREFKGGLIMPAFKVQLIEDPL